MTHKSKHFKTQLKTHYYPPELLLTLELFRASAPLPELKRVKNYNIITHYITLHTTYQKLVLNCDKKNLNIPAVWRPTMTTVSPIVVLLSLKAFATFELIKHSTEFTDFEYRESIAMV